ncbi:MAG: TIGR02996 domain-containing protein [Gemmataceae bacterium]
MSLSSADLWLRNPIYRGLLDDVIENPDEDAPRLVMADWLEEYGDQVAQDRARFIRLQVRRAQLSDYSPEAWACRSEELRLLRRHRLAWLTRLDRFVSKATFQRGFAESLVLGVAQFVKNADTLFRLTPVRQLQLLRLAQTKLTMPDLAAVPGLNRLRGLSLRHSNLGDERVAELLQVLPLAHLESLDLSGCNLGVRSLDRLAKLPLPRLRSLTLANNNILDRAERVVQVVAGRPLQTLHLGFTSLDAQAIGQLAEWPGLAMLKHLNLSGINIGARTATQFFESPYLGELDTLILSNCAIRQSGVAALARCAALKNLRVLHLESAELAAGGLENLTSGPYLNRLEDLDLTTNFLNNEQSMASLGRWPGLASVRSLCLDYNLFGNEGLRALLESEHLGSLTSLRLVGTALRPGCGSLLAECPKLSQLVHLNITYNMLKSSDIEAILESPYLKNLSELLVPPARWTADLATRLDELRPL